MTQPRPNNTAPERKTSNDGGLVQDALNSRATFNVGQRSKEPAPKSWTICAPCVGRFGRVLRGSAEEGAALKGVEPKPSDDFRKRNTPLRARVMLPSAKTKGVTVNLSSDSVEIQKETAATARKR